MNTSYKELILNDIEDLINHIGSLEEVWGDKVKIRKKVQLYYYDCAVLGRKTGVTCWWANIGHVNSGASIQYSAYVEKGENLTHRTIDIVGLRDECDIEYERTLIDTEEPVCDILTGRFAEWLRANIVSAIVVD